VKIAWLRRRRPPRRAFTVARAFAIISLVRNQSASTSEGALLISATLVSLSRKISLK
jgi:hypothetical protein